jgi:hypothetical protein
VGELGVALSVIGVIIGYVRSDAALITVAVLLGLVASTRTSRAQ